MKNVSRHPEINQIPVITTHGVHCALPDAMVNKFKYVYDLGIMVNLWSSFSWLSYMHV